MNSVICGHCGALVYMDLFSKKGTCAFCGSKHTCPTIVTPMGSSAEALLTRAFLFLEYRESAKAHDYFDRVLDLNPREVRAYMGLLLLDLIRSGGEPGFDYTVGLEKNKNYQLMLRFATEEQKTAYGAYLEELFRRHAGQRLLQALGKVAQKRRAADAERLPLEQKLQEIPLPAQTVDYTLFAAVYFPVMAVLASIFYYCDAIALTCVTLILGTLVGIANYNRLKNVYEALRNPDRYRREKYAQMQRAQQAAQKLQPPS